MNESSPNPLNQLDSVRQARGTNNLTAYFRDIASENRHGALRLLNDDSLLFASLFTLRNAINELGLRGYLNSRNYNSLLFTDYVLGGKSTKAIINNSLNKNKILSFLGWMVESGREEIEQGFDDVIDAAAINLLKRYKVAAVIPAVTDTIFERNRRDAYTYDLIWALFESSNPEALIKISERLYSENEKDVELAQKLLSFIPGEENTNSRVSSKTDWIKENYSFLYYTGETQHQSCNPQPFAVSREAKYICRPISQERGTFPEPLSGKDHKALTHFSALDDHTKELLSDFSSELARSDPEKWVQWLESPICEQIIEVARSRGGIL